MQTKMRFSAGSTRSVFSEQIKINKKVHVSALLSASFLVVFAFLFVFPVASSFSGVQAASVLSETTLSMTTSDIDLPMSITNANGTFTTSDPAGFTVATNNFSGYTLNVHAKTNDADYSKLINGESELNSISSATADGTGFNNGNWGFKPSKLNSAANNNYLPAPTYTGTTLDTTAQANNEANSYTIELGAKANYGQASGKYSNTFVIVAVANPVAYSITYNKNTGDIVTNMPENQSSDTTEDEVELSNLTPARTNHIFHGWCDGATVRTNGIDTCATNTYQPGDTYYMDQTGLNDVTLTAMWEVTGYTVNFNKNDANATGTMESQVIAYNSSANLRTNTFTKQDAVFDGWNTADDGTGADYADTASFTTPADSTGGNSITLYAKWHAVTYYTITFDANGGTGSMGTQAIANGETDELDANTFTRDGYYFNGWNETADGLGVGYGDEGAFTAPSTGNGRTLYAQWTQDTPICTADCDTDHPTLESNITIQRAYELALTQAHRGMYEEITPGSGTYQYIDSWNGQEYQGQGRQVRFAMQDMWRTYSYEDGGETKSLNVCDLVSVIGDEYQALDTRDNKLYWIAKLADGKCWMTQNLDLDLVHVADNETPLYNHWNTDLGWHEGTETYSNLANIPSFYPPYTYVYDSQKNKYIVTFLKDDNASWNPAKSTTNVANLTNDDNMSAPRSTDVGNWYYTNTYTPLTDKSLRNNYNYLSTGNNTFFSNTPYAGNGMHGHVGNYYNWNAAVATNDTSEILEGEDYHYRSICPAGWRILSGYGAGDFDGMDFYNYGVNHWEEGTAPFTAEEREEMINEYWSHFGNESSTSDYFDVAYDSKKEIDIGGIALFYANGVSNSSFAYESAPVYLTRVGTIRQGGMSNAGFDGYYWTSKTEYYQFNQQSTSDSDEAMDIMVRSTLVDGTDKYYRDRQRSVRCVAR